MAHPQVESVLWGHGTFAPGVGGSGTSTMDSFFADIVHSPYLAWLDEYRPTSGATNTRIGYGDFLGRTQITPAVGDAPPTDPLKVTVSDAQIQTELANQIGLGILPAPTTDPNGTPETTYAVFFPSNVQVCGDATLGCSGVQFCAYHGAFMDGSVAAMYDVLPDPTWGGMSSGCGNETALGNLESYTSHELTETITDPEVSFDTGANAAAPMGWYDPANNAGEVADICTTSGYDDVVDTYTVQEIWSQAAGKCLSTKTTQPAPTALSAVANADGTATLSWTAPSASSGTLNGYDVYASSTPGRIGQVIGTAASDATTFTTGPEQSGTTFSLVAENTGLVSSAPVAATSGPASPKLGSTAHATLSRASMTVGQAASVIASVSGSDAHNPITGTWTLSATRGASTTAIATGAETGAPVTIPLQSWAAQHVGTWSLKWAYSGNGNVAASDVVAGQLVIAKATPRLSAKTQFLAGGRARAIVTVTAPVTPTGRVTFTIAGHTYSVTLRGNRATFTIPLKRGRFAASARYGGSAQLNSAVLRWTITRH